MSDQICFAPGRYRTARDTQRRCADRTQKALCWLLYNGHSDVGWCYVCHVRLYRDLRGGWHAGHIIPASQGGVATADNLRPTCTRCENACGTMNLTVYKLMYMCRGPMDLCDDAPVAAPVVFQGPAPMDVVDGDGVAPME